MSVVLHPVVLLKPLELDISLFARLAPHTEGLVGRKLAYAAGELGQSAAGHAFLLFFFHLLVL